MLESEITKIHIEKSRKQSRNLFRAITYPFIFFTGMFLGSLFLVFLQEFYYVRFSFWLDMALLGGAGLIFLLIMRRILIRLGYYLSLRITSASVARRYVWERQHLFLFGLILGVLPLLILIAGSMRFDSLGEVIFSGWASWWETLSELF
jgi:hypothetical protein